MDGWVKLYRCLLDKAIWQCSTAEQKVILITILLNVNHESKDWEWNGKRFQCKPGQMVTSLASLATMCGKGISTQKIRTALNRFEKYNFLTTQSTKTGRLITVVNWGDYQGTDITPNKASNKEITKHQQRANKELTTNKNDKNDKNDKKVLSNSAKSKSFTPPKQSEVRDYCDQRNNNVDPVRFIDFYSAKGWMIGRNKMKDWKAAVRTWERKDKNDSGRKAEPVKREKTWSEEAREIAEQYTGGFEGF